MTGRLPILHGGDHEQPVGHVTLREEVAAAYGAEFYLSPQYRQEADGSVRLLAFSLLPWPDASTPVDG
jgi:hypothetical protein